MVRGQHGRCLEDQRARLVGRNASLVAGVEEPVAEELELELVELVFVEDRTQLGERLCLEQVLDVGMPEADAPEADAPVCSQRSRRLYRLHSRPKCTSTGPDVVQ